MVSHTERFPTDTVAGLEANTLADELFHVALYLFTVIGLWLLWSALSDAGGGRLTRAFPGQLILGWGVFNVVEG